MVELDYYVMEQDSEVTFLYEPLQRRNVLQAAK
jgi:hypothetical protein